MAIVFVLNNNKNLRTIKRESRAYTSEKIYLVFLFFSMQFFYKLIAPKGTSSSYTYDISFIVSISKLSSVTFLLT